MRENEYAYGVARIRCNEVRLLNNADIEQMINASDYKQVLAILFDKGWNTEVVGTDFSNVFMRKSNSVWQLICECVSDIHVLDSLVVANDFHNLKAALKCLISGEKMQKHMIGPSINEPELVMQAVKKKDYELLPEYMEEPAHRAYDVLVNTGLGQMADITLDKAALETRLDMAKRAKNKMLIELTEFLCAVTNIKIAVRCVNTGKSERFMEDAMCDCTLIDKQELKKAAMSGKEKIVELVSRISALDGIGEHIKKGGVGLEKWIDDKMIAIVSAAKAESIGIEPIIAYYIAADTEIKNVRVILSAKINGVSPDSIRKRVREVYV